MFIFHHRVAALFTPVPPGTRILHRSFAMAHMVIGSNDIAGFQIADDHVEIPAGMFTEAVNQLNDALRLAGRHIDPAIYSVAFVK